MKVGMSSLLCVRVCVVVTFICPCFLHNWHLGCREHVNKRRVELNCYYYTYRVDIAPSTSCRRWMDLQGGKQWWVLLDAPDIHTCSKPEMAFLLFWGPSRYILKQYWAENLKKKTVYLTILKVLTMVCNTQNYWDFGLCPSSGILETRKDNVSETRSNFRNVVFSTF
jgi:hypothetical protein